MSESPSDPISEVSAFGHLTEQFSALKKGGETLVTGGHRALSPDLWLSADPAGSATLSVGPAADGKGVVMTLEGGDSGRWTSLGLGLAPDILRGGRRVGALVRMRESSPVIYTPMLRYFLAGGGMRDVAARDQVVLAGGAREHLCHIPIDPALLDGATGCELNLFFHNDAFRADFDGIEPFLMT